LNPTQFFSTVVAVGFWSSNEIHLLKIGSNPPFQFICTTGALPSLPRSLLLNNFSTSHDVRHPNYKPHLVIGLADGSVVTFFYNESEKTLQAKTSVSLGNSAVKLASYNVNDKPSVFACSNRAELIYWETQRLRRSPILLQDTECAAWFNTESTPSALVLSTRDRILVGRIRDLNQVHIRSVSASFFSRNKIYFMSPSLDPNG
jgi:DNA damage-binding protein 1